MYLKIIPGVEGRGFGNDVPTGWKELVIPEDAIVSHCFDQLIISLRSPWKLSESHGQFIPGTLLALNLVSFLRNDLEGAAITELFRPHARSSLETSAITRSHLVLHILDKVKSKFAFWEYNEASGLWIHRGAEETAVVRGVSITAVDQQESDCLWITMNSFIQPTTLLMINASEGIEGIRHAANEAFKLQTGTDVQRGELTHVLKSLPAQFNADGLIEYQGVAISSDGTSVPYFIVHRHDLPLDGSTPTLLYGYGGFEVALTPVYASVTGMGWLEKGGCYVCANIRGGGEFGPEWHQSACRENKNKSYEDFIAVAEHLIESKITSSSHLGIRGGSNGGLLVLNVMLMRPDLFGAVTSAVPLADMRKYHKLLAGASWTEEYGDPDIPQQWEYLQRFSPAHNIDPRPVACGGPPRFPMLLVTTSTNDDRVHPFHARSMVKKMLEAAVTRATECEGDQSNHGTVEDRVYYYENTDGGHGGAADNAGIAFMNVVYLEFLWRVLGVKK